MFIFPDSLLQLLLQYAFGSLEVYILKISKKWKVVDWISQSHSLHFVSKGFASGLHMNHVVGFSKYMVSDSQKQCLGFYI